VRGKTDRAARVPEGDYELKIVSGEMRENEDSGSRGINWKFQIATGKYKGKTLFGYTSLKKEALWNLRNLIHAATGKNTAGKIVDLNLDSLTGKIVGSTVEDDEYTKNGRTKISSRPQVFFPRDEVEHPDADDDEDEDDEDIDDEDEDEEEDDEDLEDVDVEDI